MTIFYEEDEYQKLLDLIYDAPINGDWASVIERMSSIMGGMHVHLFGHDSQSSAPLALQSSMYDPAMVATYDEYYHVRNAWLPGVAQAPVGVAQYSQSYCPDEELVKTEFYNDWIVPQERIGGGGGVVLFNDGQRFFILGGNIRERDRNAKEDEWIRLLDRISGHVRRAFRISSAFASIDAARDTYCQALDAVDLGVFLVCGSGRMIHENSAGEALRKTGSFLHIDAGRSLRAHDPLADAIMYQTLDAIRLGRDHATTDGFALRSRYGGDVCPAMMMRLRRDAESMRSLGFHLDAPPAAILVVKKSVAVHDAAGKLLSSVFRLTPAETALALGLRAGQSLDDYAEARGVSKHTVRAQLKAIFDKTGCMRQGQLVALISRFE